MTPFPMTVFNTLLVISNAAGYSINQATQCCIWFGITVSLNNPITLMATATCIPN
jgi:hypothetical protein